MLLFQLHKKNTAVFSFAVFINLFRIKDQNCFFTLYFKINATKNPLPVEQPFVLSERLFCLYDVVHADASPQGPA